MTTKIPVELSSTPGIVDGSNATAITIDSSENVGIGTSSPNAYSNVTTMTVNGTNQGRVDLEYGGTLGGSFLALSGQTQIKASGGSQVMVFEVNDAERMRIQTGGGISFNGDTASANALDDYEEGTWTPTINSGTITSPVGYYTKIGRQVTVIYYINLTTMGSSTTQVQVGGLPFTSANVTNLAGAGSLVCRFFTGNQIVSLVGTNSSNIVYYDNTSADFDEISFGEIEATNDNDFIAYGTHTYFV